MDDFVLHPSRLGSWGACEQSAMAEWSAPEVVRVRVRRHPGIETWIGSAAHALVAGDDLPGTPELVNYSPLSPTQHVAVRQATRMAEAVKAMLERDQYGVLFREYPVEGIIDGLPVEGTIDLVLTNHYGETEIADIKTGSREPYYAWAQLALYHLLFAQAHEDAEMSDKVTVVRVPNEDLAKAQPEPEMIRRRFDDVMRAVEPTLKRVRQIVRHPDLSIPTRTPGHHCNYCVVAGECPVASLT